MGALLVAGAWWRSPGARARFAGACRWVLGSLPPGHGFWHCVLGIPRAAPRISNSAPICRRFVGVSCNGGDLVGQFAPGVHVLQSFLVTRAFGFCRFALCFLLAPNTRGAHPAPVVPARLDRRLDAQRVLPQCHTADDSCGRGTSRIRGGVSPRNCKRWLSLATSHQTFALRRRRAALPAANVRFPLHRLRQSVLDRLRRLRVGAKLVVALAPFSRRTLFLRTRFVLLDPASITRHRGTGSV